MIKTEIFDKNLAALRELLPAVASWIENEKDVDWLRVDGDQLHAIIGNEWRPMYDSKDPLKDARAVSDNVKTHKETVSVIIGLGLGHGLAEFIKTAEEGHHIIAVEPVAYIWRLVLSRHDFSKAITKRLLLVAHTKESVGEWVAAVETLKVVQDWGVFVERIGQGRPEYSSVANYTLELLNQVQCNNGTVVSSGAKIADNDIATLPWVIRYRGVSELIDLFKGEPGIVVSTGPSLARNIHIVKEIYDAGTAVIVAVGQALRPLLAYGIRPDFICTVDFGDVNMTHFVGLMDSDVPLVTINKAYAPLLRAYKGVKFISASCQPGQEKSAHGILADCGELPQGGSVAHMAYGLIVNLGCEPIAFVGQDLALGETSHIPLADSMGTCQIVDNQIRWQVDDPRSKTLYNRNDLNMGTVQYTDGWWGERVATNTGLLSFITSMERLVAETKAPVYNCTEGGAHIKGARRLFLADFSDKFCQNRIDRSNLNKILSPRPDTEDRVKKCLPLLRSDIDALRQMIRNCERGLEAALKVRSTYGDARIMRLLIENDKYSKAAFGTAKRMPTVATTIYWASRQIQTRELNVDQNPQKLLADREQLLIRISRNELILGACRNAGRDLLETYREVETVISNACKDMTALEPIGDTEPPSLIDADKYFAAGNWARPGLEAERILRNCKQPIDGNNPSCEEAIAIHIGIQAKEMREAAVVKARAIQEQDRSENRNLIPQYFDLIDLAKTAGIEKRYDDALQLLLEAVELIPNRENARWGLATAFYFLGRYNECLQAYNWLVENFPHIDRYVKERDIVIVKMKGEIK